MDYRTVVFYLAIVLVVGTLLEIYVRTKEEVKKERNLQGKIISSKRGIKLPVLLLITSIIAATAARYWH